MLTVSYATTVTLCDLFDVVKNVLNTAFKLVHRGRPFLRHIRI